MAGWRISLWRLGVHGEKAESGTRKGRKELIKDDKANFVGRGTNDLFAE
jgi:hypothetical protein